MGAVKAVERAAIGKALDYVIDNPEKNLPKAMETIDRFVPASIMAVQRETVRKAIEDKGNWYQMIVKMLTNMNPKASHRLMRTLIVDAVLQAWPVQEENREKYRCNIPWTILLDPTSACNLHCTGCWAADYGHQLNLTYDDIDSIITQGKELGIHLYIYTGGEPLVRKKATDLDGAEPAKDLCAKNASVADAWEPVANRLWENRDDPRYAMRHNGHCGLAKTDIGKLEREGRVLDHQQPV